MAHLRAPHLTLVQSSTQEEYTLSDMEFDQLRELVYHHTGISLSDAKHHMLRSRLRKRVIALGLDSFHAYYTFLVRNPSNPELVGFINAVTTNKTDFYREPHHFKFVTDKVAPEIYSACRGRDPLLRVWHAGCSTGEEPYTLSIALHERLVPSHRWTVQQLATDIDTNVLDHAQRGIYALDRLDPVPLELRRQYFARGTGRFEGKALVKPVLAEWLKFRQLNLMDENWGFSNSTEFDVIFCRNVLIYFDRLTQRNLLHRFRDMLAPNGYLIIGHSESVIGAGNGLRPLGGTVYQRVSRALEAA